MAILPGAKRADSITLGSLIPLRGELRRLAFVLLFIVFTMNRCAPSIGLLNKAIAREIFLAA